MCRLYYDIRRRFVLTRVHTRYLLATSAASARLRQRAVWSWPRVFRIRSRPFYTRSLREYRQVRRSCAALFSRRRSSVVSYEAARIVEAGSAALKCRAYRWSRECDSEMSRDRQTRLSSATFSRRSLVESYDTHVSLKCGSAILKCRAIVWSVDRSYMVR